MAADAAAYPDSRPARPRPAYLRPLGEPPARETRDDQDHDLDRRVDRLSSSSSASSSSSLLDQLPALSWGERSLVVWLTRWADMLTPKGEKHPVHYLDAFTKHRRPGFHAAEFFVRRYGARTIVEAIHQLQYWETDHRPYDTLHATSADRYRRPGGWTRYWSDSIVSPARRLNALVRQMSDISSGAKDRHR